MSLPNKNGCEGFRRQMLLDRRNLLKVGMLGATGLALPDLLRAEAQAARSGKFADKEKSVIILWMRGGPSQHDMWDPKPEAPREIRGEFAPISSKVPGIQLGELIPKSAQMMDKWSIVRSVHHRPEDGNVGHSMADQICFTGYPPGPNPDMNVMPSIGSIVSKFQQHLTPDLPAYVMIPKINPGTAAGWLGSAYDPFVTQADPAQPVPFAVQNFGLAEGLSADRLTARRELLEPLDKISRARDMASMDEFQSRALDIVTGGKAQAAFDLESEPRSMRERYGMQPEFDPKDPTRCSAPNWAQRILLARRLVEAGVRMVTVDCRWWDFHVEGFDSQRRGFLPRWDQAYTALLEDLEQRGLLEKTLVVAWGEMGRTPRVNDKAGRDHWPYVYSAAFAGGGVEGGRIVGSSDHQGAVPKDNPKLVHDVLATMYRHLGVDYSLSNIDASGRPRQVLAEGTPIDELF